MSCEVDRSVMDVEMYVTCRINMHVITPTMFLLNEHVTLTLTTRSFWKQVINVQTHSAKTLQGKTAIWGVNVDLVLWKPSFLGEATINVVGYETVTVSGLVPRGGTRTQPRRLDNKCPTMQIDCCTLNGALIHLR